MAKDQITDDQISATDNFSSKEESFRAPGKLQVEDSVLATEYDTKWEEIKAKARVDIATKITGTQDAKVLARQFDGIRTTAEDKQEIPSESRLSESVKVLDENARKLDKALGRRSAGAPAGVRPNQKQSVTPQANQDLQYPGRENEGVQVPPDETEKFGTDRNDISSLQQKNSLVNQPIVKTGSVEKSSPPSTPPDGAGGNRPVDTPEPVSADFEVRSTGTEAEIVVIAAGASILLDKLLMQAVGQVWLWALPTFGLSIVLGALAGDFIWVIKPALVKRVLAPLLLKKSARVQGMAEEIARKVIISPKVKANIIAFNATIVALFMAVVVVLVMTLYILCNAPGMGILQVNNSFGQMCKAFNTSSMVGSFNNAVNKTLPQIGGKFTTAQWDSKIVQYSGQYGIEPCVLKVVVQKESGGNPDAVGHDSHFRGGDPPNFNNPPTFGLNWNYSHGIGLTQWTIFPYDGRNWMNASTPSRNIFGQWYTGEDFRNPDTSLSLTARSFAERIRTQGSIREAFRSYNGSGPAAQAYADNAMALYNMCQSQINLGN